MTKTVAVMIELPVQVIADAVGPEVLRAVRTVDREEQRAARIAKRPPEAQLLEAAANVSKAVTRAENAMGTRDERAAVNNLISAARGIRVAVQNLKHPL